jgi:polyferredoxin
MRSLSEVLGDDARCGDGVRRRVGAYATWICPRTRMMKKRRRKRKKKKKKKTRKRLSRRRLSLFG